MEERILEEMKALLRGKDFCVLATVSEDGPHCSLMSYATDDDARELYMITHRQTKKYRNLTKNGRVSLLIDSRGEDEGAIKAMTISGDYRKFESESLRKRAVERLLTRHPGLKPFTGDADAEVFAVRVRSFQLLEGISDAHYAVVDPD